MPATVNKILDDGIDTDEDFLFYDEICKFWVLCELTAKSITRKSQKSVL